MKNRFKFWEIIQVAWDHTAMYVETPGFISKSDDKLGIIPVKNYSQFATKVSVSLNKTRDLKYYTPYRGIHLQLTLFCL